MSILSAPAVNPPVVATITGGAHARGVTNGHSINSSNLGLAIPAKTLSSDLIIACVHSWLKPIITPSGWTLLSSNTDKTQVVFLFSKTANATDNTATYFFNTATSATNIMGEIISLYDAGGNTLTVDKANTASFSAGGFTGAVANISAASNNESCLLFLLPDWDSAAEGFFSFAVTPDRGWIDLYHAGIANSNTAPSGGSNWTNWADSVYLYPWIKNSGTFQFANGYTPVADDGVWSYGQVLISGVTAPNNPILIRSVATSNTSGNIIIPANTQANDLIVVYTCQQVNVGSYGLWNPCVSVTNKELKNYVCHFVTNTTSQGVWTKIANSSDGGTEIKFPYQTPSRGGDGAPGFGVMVLYHQTGAAIGLLQANGTVDSIWTGAGGSNVFQPPSITPISANSIIFTTMAIDQGWIRAFGTFDVFEPVLFNGGNNAWQQGTYGQDNQLGTDAGAFRRFSTIYYNAPGNNSTILTPPAFNCMSQRNNSFYSTTFEIGEITQTNNVKVVQVGYYSVNSAPVGNGSPYPWNITMPSTPVPGNLLLCFLTVPEGFANVQPASQQLTFSNSANHGTDPNWNMLPIQPLDVGGAYPYGGNAALMPVVFWKVANSSETGNYTWSTISMPNYSYTEGAIVELSGADLKHPFDITPTYVHQNSNSAANTGPISVTTQTNNALLLVYGMNGTNNGPFSPGSPLYCNDTSYSPIYYGRNQTLVQKQIGVAQTTPNIKFTWNQPTNTALYSSMNLVSSAITVAIRANGQVNTYNTPTFVQAGRNYSPVTNSSAPQSGGAVNTIAISVNSTPVANNLLIATLQLTIFNGVPNSFPIWTATPTGWNPLGFNGMVNVDDNSLIGFFAFYKVANTTEANSFTFNWTNGLLNGNDYVVGTVLEYTKVDPLAPFNIVSPIDWANNGSGTQASVNSTIGVSASVANNPLVSVWLQLLGNNVINQPNSSWTVREQTNGISLAVLPLSSIFEIGNLPAGDAGTLSAPLFQTTTANNDPSAVMFLSFQSGPGNSAFIEEADDVLTSSDNSSANALLGGGFGDSSNTVDSPATLIIMTEVGSDISVTSDSGSIPGNGEILILSANDILTATDVASVSVMLGTTLSANDTLTITDQAVLNVILAAKTLFNIRLMSGNNYIFAIRLGSN